MPLSIIPVNQIFGKYDHQTRLAELNRKSSVKTIQSQVDRVTISSEALKKRAIDAALSAIKNSNQVPAGAEPASGDNVESGSYADRVVQNALEKSHELGKKKQDDLQNQADSVRDKFLERAKELEEAAAAKKKEQYEKEATPF